MSTRNRIEAAGRITRRTATLLPIGLLSGCGLWDRLFGEHKVPLPGRRELVSMVSHSLEPDRSYTVPVNLPPVSANADWPQPGGKPDHDMGNLAGGGFTRAWQSGIGAGSGYRQKITSPPVVAGGRVFTMDADAEVSAFDLRNGGRLWRRETRTEKDRSTNVGGGLAFDGNTLFAANGLAEVVAMDPATGKTRWRGTIEAPARSGPTIVGDRMFIPTAEDKLYALSTKDGTRLWTYQAPNATTSVLGQPAPAYSDGILVAGFGSGEIAGLRAESGTVLWTDSLAGGRGTAALTDITAIRGLPIIVGGQVIAIGLGGLMLSLDLHSGRRIWERDAASGHTPWVAGDWVFIVTAQEGVAALNRNDGRVRWLVDLPRFANPKDAEDPIYWNGPVLANNRLIVASSRAQLAALDPNNGKVVARQSLPDGISVPMIVASDTLLTITDDGSLTAWR